MHTVNKLLSAGWRDEGRRFRSIYANSLVVPLFSAVSCRLLSSLLIGISLEEKVAESAIRLSFQRARMKPRLIKQNERALAALHWEFSIPLVMKY